jgi:hypothetical protein
MILRIAYGNSVPALTVKYFLLLFFLRSTVGAGLGQAGHSFSDHSRLSGHTPK